MPHCAATLDEDAWVLVCARKISRKHAKRQIHYAAAAAGALSLAQCFCSRLGDSLPCPVFSHDPNSIEHAAFGCSGCTQSPFALAVERTEAQYLSQLGQNFEDAAKRDSETFFNARRFFLYASRITGFQAPRPCYHTRQAKLAPRTWRGKGVHRRYFMSRCSAKNWRGSRCWCLLCKHGTASS